MTILQALSSHYDRLVVRGDTPHLRILTRMDFLRRRALGRGQSCGRYSVVGYLRNEASPNLATSAAAREADVRNCRKLSVGQDLIRAWRETRSRDEASSSGGTGARRVQEAS